MIFRLQESKNTQQILQRLLQARWFLLAGLAAFALLTPLWLPLTLPSGPMIGILAVGAATTYWQQNPSNHQEDASEYELIRQLIIDLCLVSAIIFLSGGVTNPLISLLLPPVAVAALTLPQRAVIGISLLAIVLYSLLVRFYLPLGQIDPSLATQIHLFGMWFTFAVSTFLIAWFVMKMSQQIRQRDAALATSREKALQNERVLAVGTLAAGAAHELGSPLNTIALLAGELAQSPRLSQEDKEDIALLKTQLQHCKQILARLSHSASHVDQGTEKICAETWLNVLIQHWHTQNPKDDVNLIVQQTSPVPHLSTDPRIEQAIHNLMSNAARANHRAYPKQISKIQLLLNWDQNSLFITVNDLGPGFSAETLANPGLHPHPVHDAGQGLGLMLTRAAVEQNGGTLKLANLPRGGASAVLSLPLSTIQETE